ncbi:hemin ABC transporter substrate-binding protein [Aureimonas sp. SA4125]|uniref:heme/hemin ABC transporter substrate-binding protein n=1 Tax=Aureimonas sp. SA4125 TaxID=2826993 RepID=UPI001CC63CB4|nr:ABC transporter substrate-binding protein [Aureimonas sp. SA4125]BDA85693.1 hemin ABC transporter substrate-binding protein [Aureimonas sp. SA4125]
MIDRDAMACRVVTRSLLGMMLVMALGETVDADAAEAERIVSVGGAVTEVLYELGKSDEIAAVDSTSIYPTAATAHPNVGYIRALSAEGVLALSPDLILLEEGAGPPEAVSLLDQAGVRVVHVPSGYDAAGLPAKIEAVARAVGEESEGIRLARTIETELAALKTDLAGVGRRQRVLFVLSLVDGRPMAAGAGTAADAMIALAGGDNVLSGMTGYKALSWEAVTALQPDVVLSMVRAGSSHDVDAILSQPALAATPAGRNGALIKMDAQYLLGFGPRTPTAARDLAARLYPELKLAAQ